MRRRWLAAAVAGALVLAAGLAAAGFGVGPAAGPADATGAAGGATAPTQQSVTAVLPPQRPAASLPGYGRPTVALGDMNTVEQFILGQLYELALEHEGYTVVLSRNIGRAWEQTHALQQGTLDLYPDYLGQWNSLVAHLHRRFPTLAQSYAAGSAYARRHGFVLLPPTPFSDTDGIAVTAQYARENHVRSIADLARGTGIVIGASLEFQQSPHGLPALVRAYDLHPGYVQQILFGTQYTWLSSGNVQAADSLTTDPQLAGSQYVELRDPKHVFGFGNVVPVTTQHVIDLEGPAFAQTVEQVDSVLTLSVIRGLNAEERFDHHTAAAVARQFLEGAGILPPSRFAPVTTTVAGS